jgi:DNA-binding CsgD family transcriptional regulator
MTDLLISRPDGALVVNLTGDRVSIGRLASNTVPLPWDHEASRLHAVLERFEAGWILRDLGSTNGTYVNGRRLVRDQRLRPGDEITVGNTRLVLRNEQDRSTGTATSPPAPELTRREREVLRALCRTSSGGETFREPATIKEIARALFVTEAAVKQHLVHLYDKFEIVGAENRRVRLANEAVRRGAVALSDLLPDAEGDPTA